MTTDLDSLPSLTARQAYLAMREFIATEFELLGSDKTVHIGGLLAEMEPEIDGTTSDPGAGLTFAEAVQKVLSPNYNSAWSRLQDRA
jgi:hypothetical protein